MYAFLDRALKTVMERGTLRVTGPDGVTRDYGDGTGTPVNLLIKTPMAATKIAADADLYLGECYMDGSLDVTGGTTIYEALAILLDNGQTHRMPKVAKSAYAALDVLRDCPHFAKCQGWCPHERFVAPLAPDARCCGLSRLFDAAAAAL